MAQQTTRQWQEVRPVLNTARPHPVPDEPGELSNSNLASLVYRYGRCVSSRIDPDQWFPVANDVLMAREEAADAIAVCAVCPVRAECLEYSLRHGSDFGVHGVWGGMVEGERRLLRRRWLRGNAVKLRDSGLGDREERAREDQLFEMFGVPGARAPGTPNIYFT
jgi:WhiB family transcriptional regulator, redox-sensing transcriptional regulator